VLDSFDEIKVGVSYCINGRKLTEAPALASDWDRIEVEYHTLKGWKTSTAQVRRFSDLPEECQLYVRYLEHFLSVPIRFIGVGADRESLIIRE